MFDKGKDNEVAKSNTNDSPPPATSTPTTTPLSFAELKSKGEEALKFEREEYEKSDLQRFDEVLIPLKEIPKDSKDYKQAQALIKKLTEKSAKMGAEIIVLGPKPS